MELKTKIIAEDGRQELFITREFDLPLSLVFKAYAERELFEQWMGTKLLTLESRKYGCYQFETCDPQGNVLFKAGGVFAEFITDQRITRTFEMENTPFAVQLEYLTFEKLSEERSKLTMQIVYKSVELKNQMLALPFAQGLNMAHNRLQEIGIKLITDGKEN